MKPVYRRLLEVGDPDWKSWEDYLSLGLGPDDEDELIAMVSDPAFVHADPDSWEGRVTPHAWRALGQFASTRAIPALVGLLAVCEDDDWLLEDLPKVFEMIGPEAVPALTTFLHDGGQGIFAPATAAGSLTHIAQRHPEERDRCVAILMAALKPALEQDPTLNSILVGHLVDLGAVEAASLIEAVYESERADLLHMGDWEDVQIALGLLEQRITPRPPLSPFGDRFRSISARLYADAEARREQEKRRRKAEARKKARSKQKRKAARKSRSRNRRG